MWNRFVWNERSDHQAPFNHCLSSSSVILSAPIQFLPEAQQNKGSGQRRSGKDNPGLSGTTVRSVHLTLHCAFERAVKERLIPRTPTDGCIAPKVQKVEMKTLLPEQLKACLTAANARNVLPMFCLELVNGLRKGELVALLWPDLDTGHKRQSPSASSTSAIPAAR